MVLIIELCDHNNIPFEFRRLGKDMQRKTDKMMKVVRLYVNSFSQIFEGARPLC